MLRKRVIVCLDVSGDRVVKGTRFRELREVGDPVQLAERYQQQGADEIIFLDVSASVQERSTVYDVVRQTAERLFIPLTVGGGIRSVDDVGRLLRSGADKVSVNSAAVHDPPLLTAAADKFGAQCVVASIDASERLRAEAEDEGHPPGPSAGRTVAATVYTHGGRRATDLDATEWAARCVELGAGEILITSIDHDGVRTGFDLELTRAVRTAVDVPVIASGGAGGPQHFVDVFKQVDVEAALAAGIFHSGAVSVHEVKAAMRIEGIEVR
ncbi:MAG TPA: imidazole glycerol phosphate synthase subunit HisF [Acidobacteriota bacterium]|nr:imidazole glycerol phosphate synthase subunit HisF [Acidobacteriota bacterium]